MRQVALSRERRRAFCYGNGSYSSTIAFQNLRRDGQVFEANPPDSFDFWAKGGSGLIAKLDDGNFFVHTGIAGLTCEIDFTHIC